MLRGRSRSSQSLLLHEYEPHQVKRKIRLVFLATFIISAFLTYFAYLGGLFRHHPSASELAKQQALQQYSDLHRKAHWSPRGLFSLKQNAVILILCRNDDLEALIQTLINFEDRFNRKFAYPYVILNDEEFTAKFKRSVKSAIRFKSNAKIEFGMVPREHWSYPSWINQTLAAENRAEMKKKGIIYGDSESYRFMCRYFSGFFFDHPLLLKYEYYWRVEPGVRFLCQIPFDPFAMMKQEKKQYGFVISLQEIPETVTSLWGTTLDFARQNENLLSSSNTLKYFMRDDDGYNHCHFWSNFEIAQLSFFRSPAYRTFFDHLDRRGGFFYERWGDAPVHSLAVGLFLRHEEVQYFDDIGYHHSPFSHCPMDITWRQDQNCDCDPFGTNDITHSQCRRDWDRFRGAAETENDQQ